MSLKPWCIWIWNLLLVYITRQSWCHLSESSRPDDSNEKSFELYTHRAKTTLTCEQSHTDDFISNVHRLCKAFDRTPSCVIKLDRIISFDKWSLSRRPIVWSLPVDSSKSNDVRIVKNAIFSQSNPTPFTKGHTVQLIAWSSDVLSRLLDLDPEKAADEQSFVDFVSGNAVHRSSLPLTHRYGGHQFGVWAGQLGDGRAHMLGEYISLKTAARWELQLKGSGKTPFSRNGDGRAVLRSSVREFLASEAMHHLGMSLCF